MWLIARRRSWSRWPQLQRARGRADTVHRSGGGRRGGPGREIAFDLLRLRDVADAEGQPFRGAPYLTFGAQVRRLDLRPGDAITFVAHVAALDAERAYLGGDVDAPLRLVRPAKVARA